MKHTPVAIRFPDLVEHIGSSVSDALELLDIGDQTLAALIAAWELRDGAGRSTERIDAAIEQQEADLLAAMKDTWFRVTWPDRVEHPKYNGEARYEECATKAHALEGGAVEYGTEGDGES